MLKFKYFQKYFTIIIFWLAACNIEANAAAAVLTAINESETTGEFNKVETFISGGNLADEKQFPYQAGLNIETKVGQFTWCGGSLISNRWILTAGHCVHDIVGVIVYLGATHRLQPKTTIKIPLTNIIIHSEFNIQTLENDIALISLPTPVTLSDSIHPINIPKLMATHSSYTYHEAVATGWGRENDSSMGISNNLRYVIRYTLSNAECQFVYGNSIRSSNICIDTTGGQSTCSGDSGGPLVTYDEHQNGLIQIGLTSFGKASGCTIGYPAVFTRITSYLEWIRHVSGVVHV